MLILCLILLLTYFFQMTFNIEAVLMACMLHGVVLLWSLHWRTVLIAVGLRFLTSFSPYIVKFNGSRELSLFQFVLLVTLYLMLFRVWDVCCIVTTGLIISVALKIEP
jgi:hypothetical protein